MVGRVEMRAVLAIGPTLALFAILLLWSLFRLARFGMPGARDTWELLGQLLGNRALLAFLFLTAGANVSFSALAGYINPRDYVQDVIAARQFLKHAALYPGDAPQMGIVELSAPIRGRSVLEKLPVVRGDLNTLTEPPIPGMGHPPVLGIALAAPVFFLGLRGSFLFVLFLSVVLLYVTERAILRELFPRLPFVEMCVLLGLVFAWYPVDATLRSGQDSIILFALITAGWLMLRRNKPWIAGGAIGLAACLHAFPALLVLYFAFRSRRAFVSAIATIAALSLAAAELTVGQTFREWLSVAVENSRRFVPKAGNLSLAGLITSFSRGMSWGEHVNIIAPAVLLIVAGALVLFLWRWNRRDPRAVRLDVEYSVFVVAMLQASPLSWGRYLPIVLLPLAVLIRNWRLRRPAWAVSALLTALVFMSFSDSTSVAVSNWIASKWGFVIGWLVMEMPSFSIMALLPWLASAELTDLPLVPQNSPVSKQPSQAHFKPAT